jgi:putative ABC transport system ATP-binding protein
MSWNRIQQNSASHYRQSQQTNGLLIELRGVVKKYESTASTVTALNGIDLRVNAGEFVVVLGKSGAGKSTLVNMLAGIDRPTSGEIRVAGMSVHTLGEDDRAAWRGRHVGVVLQFFQLLPSLTVIQNVMLPMDFANRYPIPQQRERAMHLLAQMDIADHAHKLPSAVSGGQQQRIAIARALANDPPILVADEPTGNLDSTTAQSVFGVFQDLVRQGKTIVMVTHDRDLARQAQRTIQLADGEIVKRNA